VLLSGRTTSSKKQALLAQTITSSGLLKQVLDQLGYTSSHIKNHPENPCLETTTKKKK
jgi:hypothetical protein